MPRSAPVWLVLPAAIGCGGGSREYDRIGLQLLPGAGPDNIDVLADDWAMDALCRESAIPCQVAEMRQYVPDDAAGANLFVRYAITSPTDMDALILPFGPLPNQTFVDEHTDCGRGGDIVEFKSIAGFDADRVQAGPCGRPWSVNRPRSSSSS